MAIHGALSHDMIPLPGRQVPGRIDRFAQPTYFKVKFDTVRITVAHLGNLLALAHRLIFFDQQSLVMGVSRQVSVVVLDRKSVV